jgi:hypothetical protein
MAERPTWRRVFDTVERGIGQPLETMTNTSEFARAMALGTRLKQSVERSTQSFCAIALNRMGMPAVKDVTEVRRGIGRIERRLQQLSHELELLREEQQASANKTDDDDTR